MTRLRQKRDSLPAQKNFANATWRAGALISALLVAGCASLVGTDKETLTVTSTPPDAQILIIDQSGRTVYRGRTPDAVALQKSDDRYWGGKQFTVAISKRGYQTQRVQVDTHPNPLYVGGNWLFGGLIGWLIDPASGRMSQLSTDGIEVELQALPGEATAMPVATPTVPTVEIPASGSNTELAPGAAASGPAIPAIPAAPSRETMAGQTAGRAAASTGLAAPAPGLDAAGATVATTPPVRTDPAPVTPPIAPPAEPRPLRPYWPTPPALPVSPSTAAPAAVRLAAG